MAPHIKTDTPEKLGNNPCPAATDATNDNRTL
jgi:hypothetical protein